MNLAGATTRNRTVVISALGITQILAWGSSYYLPAILSASIAAETGWSLTSVVAGFSCGLVVAGLGSPLMGRLVQRHGGRPVLAGSSVLLAASLALMATQASYPVFLASWILMGLGMAGGLYDAGFATLGRLYGHGARAAITQLTLFGGFASTVCWPLSAFLMENFGWRAVCLAYAAIHLAICLPIHLLAVPAPPPLAEPAAAPSGSTSREATSTATRLRMLLLGLVIVSAALIGSMLSVHLIAILQLRGLDLAVAVGFGALVGPAQVGGRIAELAIGRNRYHPIWTMLASALLLAIGVGLLMASLPLTGIALVLYGAGNGIHTIARGAVPLVLFGPERYATVMGRLAAPSLAVQALAPALGAVLLARGELTVLSVLLAVALLNVASVAWLAMLIRRAG